MKINPLKQGAITDHDAGIGGVTDDMVRERAEELAAIDGRPPRAVTKNDWEAAKRELTGKSGLDAREALLDSLPESARWNPLPGSPGKKSPTYPSEDEDEEGRSDSARLAEEGIAEATHEQMLLAANPERPLHRRK